MKTEHFFLGEPFLKISENVRRETEKRVKERQQTGREVKAKVNWTTNVNRSVSSAMLLGEGMTFYRHIYYWEEKEQLHLNYCTHTTLTAGLFWGGKSSNWVCRCVCVCVCVCVLELFIMTEWNLVALRASLKRRREERGMMGGVWEDGGENRAQLKIKAL